MDIERLTKMQIILLTLLVSFVTSIATGIVTVTLLEQAPPAITQTINRVVERTVERVVPTESQGASVITQEKTIVVKEEDLITDSIERNTRNLVQLSSAAGGEGVEGDLIGMGMVVSREGLIATDNVLVEQGGKYRVKTSDGNIFEAVAVYKVGGSAVALLKIQPKEEDSSATFAPVALADLSTLKLGQTVLSLGGSERISVGVGIISALLESEVEIASEEEEEPRVVNVLSYINTSLTRPSLGSPLVNIFGEVVGIHTAQARREVGPSSYTPALDISEALSAFGQSQNEEAE